MINDSWEQDRKYVLSTLDRLEKKTDELISANTNIEGFKGRILGAAAVLSLCITLIVSIVAAFLQKN